MRVCAKTETDWKTDRQMNERETMRACTYPSLNHSPVPFLSAPPPPPPPPPPTLPPPPHPLSLITLTLPSSLITRLSPYPTYLFVSYLSLSASPPPPSSSLSLSPFSLSLSLSRSLLFLSRPSVRPSVRCSRSAPPFSRGAIFLFVADFKRVSINPRAWDKNCGAVVFLSFFPPPPPPPFCTRRLPLQPSSPSPSPSPPPSPSHSVLFFARYTRLYLSFSVLCSLLPLSALSSLYTTHLFTTRRPYRACRPTPSLPTARNPSFSLALARGRGKKGKPRRQERGGGSALGLVGLGWVGLGGIGRDREGRRWE